ncbi:MAG: hypothetical protein FJ191_02480 [Gammaproteobacteria bacterium]|nr:hypothetical protein [Gammaproteobacteria bacterium]
MKRYLWLIRREIWENRAIWITPLVVLGALLLLVLAGPVRFGPIGGMDTATPLGALAEDRQLLLLLLVYAGIALVMFMVMGVVAFFYALDSLYADRRDRSVLFWKSLPLSDADTVLSKFLVGACVIPLVACAGALLAQLLVATGGSVRLALAGGPAALLWQPAVLGGAFGIGLLWSLTAMLWYAPVIAYLMLASAWAPRGPFLWAVLPPVGAAVLERMLLRSAHVGDFISERLFGLYQLLGNDDDRQVRITVNGDQVAVDDATAREGIARLSELDPLGALQSLYVSADLWLGVVVAGLLLGAAIWLRRYREN